MISSFLLTIQIIGFTSFHGGMGNYEVFTARPLDFGNFSFDMIADYFYESYIDVDTTYNDTFHDRRHFGSGNLALTFSPLPYTEIFAKVSGFLHYDEKTEPIEIPIHLRKDAYVYGAKEVGGGIKLGFPIVRTEHLPFMISMGGRFGLFSSFHHPASYDTLLNRGFPQPENHGPDYDLRFLASLKFGALGLHINGGQMVRGRDRNTHLDRPDGGIYGIGLDLSARNRFWLFGEMYGVGDTSYFTTGLKLGLVPNFTFNFYFKKGLVNPEDWRVSAGFAIFSTITPRVKKGGAIIAGRVADARTGAPIVGIVSFPGSDVKSTMTNPDGTYRIEVSPGTYMILVQASGYRPKERPITVKKGSEILFDVLLTRGRYQGEPTGRITGRIFSEREEPIEGEVEVLGADVPEVKTEGGHFSIEVAPGRYEVAVHAPGYRSTGKVVYVREEGEEVRADFHLTEEELEIPSGFGKISGFVRDGETEAPIKASV
ncbi:MAG TPA: hypothetical protein EYP24_00730, partial [bacterium (Candidatus Stahlbacteria)]|nr:hypothetical protein [Candidatus Stahlbacteria bacterium]